MLRQVLRSSVEGCYALQSTAFLATRAASKTAGDVLKDRESAAERLWFSKEDEKLMRDLLAKVKKHSDEADPAAGQHNAADDKALDTIVGKYKMSPEDVAALKKWRH